MRLRKYWIALAVVVGASFLVLGGEGVQLHHELPPVPGTVVGPTGQVVTTRAAIQRGQAVWESLGGQEMGSIWGHGAYVAPDWTADWIHREATFVLDDWARAEGATGFAALPVAQQGALKARLKPVMRKNTYDAKTDTVTLPAVRVAAFHALSRHYAEVFTAGKTAYAIPANTLTDPSKLTDLAAFYWWASWVASTDRPGTQVTYTQNWPHDALVGNVATAGSVMWSFLSVILLLAAIGAMVWWRSGRPEPETRADDLPDTDPLLGATPTPSQRATYKYFVAVVGMMVLQVAMGALTAHYGVEGNGVFGFPLAKYLPYAVTRSWHLQLGIFWIATAWLATGLYLAPLLGGGEPRYQRLGVNVLFGALVLVVGGTLVGQWLSVKQDLPLSLSYLLGHQGFEYVDLGRVWQIALLVGLFLWLGLMLRGLWPALKRRDEQRPLLLLFTLSALAIASFYGAGLMYGAKTELGSVEYWRWWVVHLWVEGFFEVFATVAIAFLFVKLGLLNARRVTPVVLFSTVIFLAGGIIGTFHHLYFAGTPSPVLALGAVFSALEVVPLVLVGYEVWQNIHLLDAKPWLAGYKWPIYFFVAVSFWNLVGAGLFGFLINPPVALYYMQGLNLTPLHGHTALFGVYGMLGIGLMLFTLRALKPTARWNDRILSVSFWTLNGGLALMSLLSLLPVGLLQTMASVEHGTWYARSAAFLQTPLMQDLRWMRMPGDVVFTVGIALVTFFVIGLPLGWATLKPGQGALPAGEGAPVPAPVNRAA